MYQASEKRYDTMNYVSSGNSGLKLPTVSLGLWHNFGDTSNYETMKALCFTAFDNGITHFDLANNYGPEPGSAEKNFGRILNEELGRYRDELLISTKATRRWRSPWEHWPMQFTAERRCMRDCPIMTGSIWKLPLKF